MALARRARTFEEKRQVKKLVLLGKRAKELQVVLQMINDDPATIVDPAIQVEIDKQLDDPDNILP